MEDEMFAFEQKYTQSQNIIQQNKDATIAPKTNKGAHITGCIIGALLLLGGVCASVLFNLILGIALALCGLAYGVLSIILLNKKPQKTEDNTLKDISALWDKDFNNITEFYDFVATQKALFSSIQKAQAEKARISPILPKQT